MAVNQGSLGAGVIAKCPNTFVADNHSWRIIEWRIIEGLLFSVSDICLFFLTIVLLEDELRTIAQISSNRF